MEIKAVNIGSGLVNNHVLETDRGIIVIDTGFPGGFDQFRTAFLARGYSLADIAYIFVTHTHNDHVGFLKELMEAVDVPVVLHSEAVQRLTEGVNRFVGGCPTKQAFEFCSSGEGAPVFPPVQVGDRARLADKNPNLFVEAGIPAEIVFLPGHTSDSIGLSLDDGRLFCGDAAMNGFPSEAHYPVWIEDLESFGKTWDVIMKSGARVLYPGHGEPIPAEELGTYRDFMKGKSLLKLG